MDTDSGQKRFGRGRTLVLAAVVSALLGACQKVDRGPPPIPATDPTAVDTPPPDYPLEVFCAGIGGEVILLVSLGVEGVPTEIRTERTSGQPLLDTAAVEAVRKWRFNPATSGGRPIPGKLRVPVKFTKPAIRPDVCFQFDEQQRTSK